MNCRFKMNRIGFVNFWLYDEEEFEFEDGKLLLRGQNASGKSITTQSFIPFVLDGDRTPSRLDPFGSSDRRMEYYFLGEEGKEESTGYLFLEFKRAGSEEYRTIGIGQRAKKGKPMDFWGFVILDGRRIGRDLFLYREVGSSKLPLDRREMKEVLGDGNFFTTSQSDYKNAVNQHIFGFRKDEQYEQFIRLLVKVRAPKLSKEFKPTRVYEILNDSLQTLSDEDLRAMVDAMEKMDEIQDRLELLKRALDDVKIIRNEYTRYNQYMLAKKAQAYLTAREKAETEKRRLEEQEQKRTALEDDRNWKSRRLEELEGERKLKEAELEGLLDTDLQEMDQKMERAREEKKEAEKKAAHWESRIQECKDQITQGEYQIKEIRNRLAQKEQALKEEAEELDELQEILQWDQHKAVLETIAAEDEERGRELGTLMEELKNQLLESGKAVSAYMEIARQYDELAQQLELLKKRREEEEQELLRAREEIVCKKDEWIVRVYGAAKEALEWRPAKEVLEHAEEKIRAYQSAAEAEAVQELFRTDYERQRQGFLDRKSSLEHQKKLYQEELNRAEEELLCILDQEELEPERDKNAKESREALRQAGVRAVPFYRAVEFAEDMEENACARLEAQLEKAGLLDALVIPPEDLEKVKNLCPDFLDTVLYVKKRGDSGFSRLTASEELEPELGEAVRDILSNIYESEGPEPGICLGRDGSFRQGILTGRADRTGDAAYIGVLARKRRKEQKIRELEDRIRRLQADVLETEKEIRKIQERLEILQEEYLKLPGFSELNASLDLEKEQNFRLEKTTEEWNRFQKKERELTGQKDQKYQDMLSKCKRFPYGRTEEAYEEACQAAGEYSRLWREIRDNLFRLKLEREMLSGGEDRIAQAEERMDDAYREKQDCTGRIRSCELRIRQFEEYLSRPEIIEKASRLETLKKELEENKSGRETIKDELAGLEARMAVLLENGPELKKSLEKKMKAETCLRAYFEEELALKLVIDRGDLELSDCAEKALGTLRDSDKNREPTEMLQSLHRVYQGHNGSLVSYGTALEECFDQPDAFLETENLSGAIRKRVRVASSWNGKKVYLETFYGILRQAIEETELLIRQKDRELFEDILSQTISQQLTDRIAESRRWVSDMSRLMREMDTSMGLVFSLEWKPRKAENDAELDSGDLEQILLRDHRLLTLEDIEKVAAHFRSKIHREKQRLEETDSVVNYMDLVREALDYRRWYEFHMYFRRGDGEKKLLTNAAFNRFSGGEKAMAMYVPLFAAVNAQYKKAEREDHPRIIALDEAFAGVDDRNISSMFELVHKLDFDYIMNSQALWGCYETVKGLRIAELSRPQDSQIVSVIRYTWNGRERILDVQ